jgi:hypothetical protein
MLKVAVVHKISLRALTPVSISPQKFAGPLQWLMLIIWRYELKIYTMLSDVTIWNFLQMLIIITHEDSGAAIAQSV